MKSTIFSALFLFCFTFVLSLPVTAQSNKGKKEVQTLAIRTSGKCEMCKSKIESAARSVKGVKSATLDGTKQVVTVSFRPDKTSGDAIRKAISKAGYAADDIPADVSAKEKLPNCCK